MWDPSPLLFYLLCISFFFPSLFSLNRAQVSLALSISCLIQWALLIVLPAAHDSQFRDKWADFQCKLASYLAQRPERLGMTCTTTAVASVVIVRWALSRRPKTNQVSARRRLFCYVKRVHLIPDEHGKKKGGSERKKETVEINRPHQMIKDSFALDSLPAPHQCLIHFQLLFIARSSSLFLVSFLLSVFCSFPSVRWGPVPSCFFFCVFFFTLCCPPFPLLSLLWVLRLVIHPSKLIFWLSKIKIWEAVMLYTCTVWMGQLLAQVKPVYITTLNYHNNIFRQSAS